MQSLICRGCCSQLDSIKKAKNIFINELLPGSGAVDSEQTDLPVEKNVTISSALELVTGFSISETDGISPYLCDACMEKLMTYVDFRKQLFSAHKLLLNSKNSLSTCHNILTAREADSSNHCTEKTESTKHELIDSTENVKNSLDTFERQSSPDNLNIDGNSSISSVFTDSPEIKHETRDTRDINDEDNNNLSESEASNLSADIHISEENGFKNQIHDVESDIDVCSGEEDDVLELDIPSKKDETIEIGSSSESEIEVCDNEGDYIPRNKRVG